MPVLCPMERALTCPRRRKWRWTTKWPWACGVPARSASQGFDLGRETSASARNRNYQVSCATTAATGKERKRSIVFMPWPTSTTFSRMVGFLDTGFKMWGHRRHQTGAPRIHHQGDQQTPPAAARGHRPRRHWVRLCARAECGRGLQSVPGSVGLSR